MGSLIGSTGLRYIGQFGNGKRGFYVRIPCATDANKIIRKEFSSSSLSMSELRKKAISWRDKTYLEQYGHPVPKQLIHRKQTNNASSSLPGVRRHSKKMSRTIAGRTYTYSVTFWIAEVWLEPGCNGERSGKSRSKIFTIRKYGDDGAFSLATKWRVEMVKRLLVGGEAGFEKWWKTVKGVGKSSTADFGGVRNFV